MKKLLIAAALTVGISASVLAQGTVIFESDQSTGTITTNDNNTSHFAHTGTYQVALLWAAGTTPVPVGNLTQLVVFTGNNNGFFHDGTPVTTGAQTPGAPAIFLVQGWTVTSPTMPLLSLGTRLLARVLNSSTTQAIRPPRLLALLSARPGLMGI